MRDKRVKPFVQLTTHQYIYSFHRAVSRTLRTTNDGFPTSMQSCL